MRNILLNITVPKINKPTITNLGLITMRFHLTRATKINIAHNKINNKSIICFAKIGSYSIYNSLRGLDY